MTEPSSDTAHCLVTAPVTQQDVADAIGASREAAARELHCFRLAGAVATGRRHLLITDVRLLRARARWSADGPDLVLCGMCRCGRFRG